MSQESKQKIKGFLEGGHKCVSLALSKHELFTRIIPGNPSLIIRYATALINPASQIKSMKDVYAKAVKQLVPIDDDAKSALSRKWTRGDIKQRSLWECTAESV